MGIYGTSGLASYLMGSNSSQSSLSQILNTSYKNLGALGRDKYGRAVLPTMKQLNAATKPQDKLSLAGQMANGLKMQTDAAAQTGIVSRLPDMAKQAKQVMDALSSAVTQMKSQQGALKNSQASISSTLGSLRGVMSQIGRLMDKLPADQAKSVKEILVQMDAQASSIAKTTNISWKSIFKNSSTSVTSTTPSKKSLVDLYA